MHQVSSKSETDTSVCFLVRVYIVASSVVKLTVVLYKVLSNWWYNSQDSTRKSKTMMKNTIFVYKALFSRKTTESVLSMRCISLCAHLIKCKRHELENVVIYFHVIFSCTIYTPSWLHHQLHGSLYHMQ